MPSLRLPRMNVPEKPSIEGLEAKWDEWWEAAGTYCRFDRTKPREDVFAIDTPPPTASGSLHIGHVLSYTHTDVIAQFKRMQGKTVFYPIGWDDNGLATERRCRTTSASGANRFPMTRTSISTRSTGPMATWSRCRARTSSSSASGDRRGRRRSRPCSALSGLSVDWNYTYTTIDERSRRASQRSFVRLLQRGLAYQSEAPTMWDVDYQTALAQAEIEDREIDGAYHRIRFELADASGSVEIETSRPELLPACVALVVNPEDERYRALVGTNAGHAVVRRRGPDRRPRAGRTREGDRDRDDLHVRRHHRRHLVARAQLPRVVVQRDGTIAPPRWGETGMVGREPAGGGRAGRARGTHHERPEPGSPGCCPSRGT